jgi:transcriptional regulator with XRE-family HTH domain
MPAPKQLDPDVSPLHFFGAEFRRARELAGMSQGAFGATVPVDVSTVSRVESGDLTPTDAFIEAMERAFPHLDLLVRFYRASPKWSAGGPIPAWFEEWLKAERVALTLRYWQPIIVPGICQTADYARSLLSHGTATGEAVDALVSARLARRAIFDKQEPPSITVVLDELVLRREIGSPEIMHEQLASLSELSERPCIAVHVVPAGSFGAYAGLPGALNIASGNGTPDVLHMDAVEGMTTERHALVRKAEIAFEGVRGDALPRGASRDLIMKVADEVWKNLRGGNPRSVRTAASA